MSAKKESDIRDALSVMGAEGLPQQRALGSMGWTGINQVSPGAPREITELHWYRGGSPELEEAILSARMFGWRILEYLKPFKPGLKVLIPIFVVLEVRDARAAVNDARKRHPERPELAWIVAVQHAGKFLNRLVLPPMIDITRPDVHWEYADSLTTR